MAIGKKNVEQLNLSRVVLEKTVSGEDLAVCRFNGHQRDAFMSMMIDVRDRYKDDGAADTPATLTAEKAKAMAALEYTLVAMCVADGDALADGKVTLLFGGPEEVSLKLLPETISEWVGLCQKVNGLGDKEEAKAASDFSIPRAARLVPPCPNLRPRRRPPPDGRG
jgi:hypothetical protein